MGRPRFTSGQASFAGGLNTTASEYAVGEAQVRRADNARLSQIGDITKRPGTQRVSSSAISGSGGVRNAFCWRTAATHEYLAVVNGVLFSGGTYAVPMTWTSKGGTFAASATPSFAAFRDGTGEVVYIADGGPLNKWDGTTRTENIASTPSVTQLAVYNQRLFGITGSDQTLHFSALNNGDSLGVAGADSGSAIVRTFSNQKLTALLTLRGSLALFHVSGVSRFTGLTQDDIAIGSGTQGISSDTGTIAPRSAIAVEGVGFFLSERGAFTVTDAGVESLDTPERPDPTASILAAMSGTDFAGICVAHVKPHREIWWFLPGNGVYIYNYRLGAWTGPTTSASWLTTQCLFEGVDADGAPVVCAGSSDGYVRRCDVVGSYKDDVLAAGTGGSTYTFAVRCRRVYSDELEGEKAWRFAYATVDLKGSQTARLAWSTQTGASGFTLPSTGNAPVWGSFVWGAFTWGSVGSKPYRIPLSGRGSYLDLTFSDDGAAGSTWSRLAVEGFQYGRRG